ncbi:MAG: hypothetical protein U0521_08540 [Anaerolineae bacterium]
MNRPAAAHHPDRHLRRRREILTHMNQGRAAKSARAGRTASVITEAGRDDVSEIQRRRCRRPGRATSSASTPDYYQLAYDLFVPRDAALITSGA